MFQSLFNGLSGLFGFSRSLNTVSNNIANMNTPGFRGSDNFFENILGGRGTRVAGEGLRTRQGDLRATGNSTDLAIDGAGYFVLKDTNGDLHYTRAGQFRFNDQGLLVDSVSGFKVMAFDSEGKLSEVNLEKAGTLAPTATTQVKFAGNLSPTSTSFKVSDVKVFDAQGGTRNLSIEFSRPATGGVPGVWQVTVKDEAGLTVSTGEVRFSAGGTLQAGFESMNITLGTQTIKLSFGTAGAFDGATQLSGSPNNIAARVTDGRNALALTGYSFDDKGNLKLEYGAGETRDGGRLALADLPGEAVLKSRGGRLYSLPSSQVKGIGRAGEGAFGRIAGGSLEVSNVDLTQEFADMIIIQRGYQASSRVLTVTNEMIDNLYNSTRGG
jgi:flagellar hook protein FlgE